ncbi:MAG: terminase large subunit [Mesorhizobium sp.]|nr:terminase TerL endonuclease subunit [Mesorhizobium sp.]MCO5159812.1 terminase large subunit [Mesorhizobium sp.]
MKLPDTYPHWLFSDDPLPDPHGYGERAIQFARLLRHPKNPAPGHPFILSRWQERFLRKLYGTTRSDGTRQYRSSLLLLPRGNRKTALSSFMGLLHTLSSEAHPNGQVILGAINREQSKIAFDEAASILRADPRLVKATRIYDAVNAPKKIVYPRKGVVLDAISGDGSTQHGKTPSFAFCDELHEWKSDSLWRAIKSGMPKTRNSLLVVATTAGRGQDNIAHEIVDYGRKVARGDIDDPSFLPVIFETPLDADWRDERWLYAMNPGLADGFQDIDGLRALMREGEASITAREAFRQYHLNCWLDHSASPFVEMSVYDKGADPIDEKALAGRPCWIGVDMSTTTDLTAVVAAFADDDGGFTVLPWFACPGDNLRQRGERDGVPYPAWAEAGYIKPTPGNVIDYRAVEAHIRDLCERFDVREIGFDPAYAAPVMLPLQDDGFPCIQVRQGWVTQSPALNVLERAIVGEKFRHGGHPVLRWNFANVAIHTDSAGNRTMHKGKSTDRIDGAAATWMAVSRAAAGDHGGSIYTNTARRPAGLMFF